MLATLLHLDLAARSWVVLHRDDALTRPLYLLTVVGRFGGIWVASALVLAGARRISWSTAGRIVLAIAIPLAISDYVLKPLIDRPRPFVAEPAPPVIGRPPHDPSFPSGHATSSFAGATALTIAEPHAAIVWWVLATAIAFSRVYIGVHYPLDVLAGAAIGAVGAWMIMARRSKHRSLLP